MRRGLDWYKREQRAILDAIRAAKMTDRQAAIYNIVLDLIYDGGGETPDDPRHIGSYLSNVGQAAARTTIQQLVDMGKLTRADGMLHQKRAENEAKTRGNLSETRAEVGRLGGISSGVSRRKAKENNALDEASASTKHEAEKRESREENRVGGDRVRDTRAPDLPEPEPAPLTFRERIRAACGVDPTSGLTGRGSARLADQADMLRVKGWFQLGLTPDEILIEISTTMAGKTDGPPSSLKFFDKPMARLAAAKAAPPPDIRDVTPPASQGGPRNDRAAQPRPDRRADESQRLSRILDVAARGTT